MNFDIRTASILETVIAENIDMIVKRSTKNTLHFCKISLYFNLRAWRSVLWFLSNLN